MIPVCRPYSFVTDTRLVVPDSWRESALAECGTVRVDTDEVDVCVSFSDGFNPFGPCAKVFDQGVGIIIGDEYT